jgi:hypothetical protein
MSDEIEPADAGPEVLPEPIPEPVAAPVPAPDPAGELVSRWVFDCIHNSPVAQATEAFNHLVTTALPELRRRLESLGKE